MAPVQSAVYYELSSHRRCTRR